MNSNFIQFKKERDLGAIISDCFNFIRLNWKGYFGTIFRIAGPSLIVLIVALGFYMYSLGGFVELGISGNFQDVSDGNFIGIALSLAVAFISGIVFYVLTQLSSMYYIRMYIANKGEGIIDSKEVYKLVIDKFWSFLGFGITMIILVMLGTMLCILPGIYLGVVLSLGIPIMVFENKGIGDTLSHCFRLIKEHWWETFGIMFVVGLLVGIIGQAFSVPNLIYYFFKIGTSAMDNDPTAILDIFSDPIYLALLAFGYIGQFFLSTITYLSNVFIYFDLNEQKNMTGTLESIDSLGA
ncbi:hypothetical protein KH5_20560 [Urechidicola sp. KH5]